MMKRYTVEAAQPEFRGYLLTFLQAPLPPATGAGARVFDPVSPDQLILRGRNRADDNAPTWQGPWRRQLGPARTDSPAPRSPFPAPRSGARWGL